MFILLVISPSVHVVYHEAKVRPRNDQKTSTRVRQLLSVFALKFLDLIYFSVKLCMFILFPII